MTFKNRFIFILLILLLPLSASSKVLQERVVLDGKLKISMPVEFSLMSEDLRNIKYPNRNAPTEVYTNDATTVNIAFGERHLGEADFTLLKDYFEQLFVNMNPQVEIVPINGVDALKISFISKAIDTDIYNHIVIIPLADGENHAFINFNITKKEYANWKDVYEKVLHSITLIPH